jgi:hypothetical protein
MGKLLVSLMLLRYNRGVAQSEIVITEFNHILEHARITT